MPSSHPVNRPIRRIIAGALTLCYLIISLGPLATLATHADAAAHLLTGACSGDCDICGCSPEKRAARSCCCSKKRQQLARLQKRGEEGVPACCQKKPAERETIIASCGCPCGGDHFSLLSESNKGEILPYYFDKQFAIPCSDTVYPELSRPVTSRPIEPPDPPPRQA